MEHLQDDFGRGPISQVPASWFNSVAKFINNLIPGSGIKFQKHLDGNATIIESTASSGEMGDSPTNNLDASDTPDAKELFDATFTDWEAGGDDGLKLRIYGIVTGDNNTHYLNPIDIEINNNGTVRSVKKVPDTSPTAGKAIMIGA